MLKINTGYSAILRMAAPISMGAFVQFLVVLTDNFFLSREGEAQINGAGNAGLMYLSFSMIAMAVSSTGQILIARRMGQNNRTAGYQIVRSGALVMAGLAVVLIAALYGSTHWLAANTFKDALTAEVFSNFMDIRMWGFIPYFGMLLLTALFLGTARSNILWWVTIATSLINIGGDYVLIPGRWGFPALGAEGAAIASFASECGGLGVLLIGVALRHPLLFRRGLRLKYDELLKWGRLAFPMMCQLTFSVGTWTMFFFFVEHVGLMELKVSHVVRNYFMIAFFIVTGVRQTGQTFISALLGSGHESDVVPTMRRLMTVNLIGVMLVAHGLWLYPELFAGPFFLDDPVGLQAAVRTLPIIFGVMLMYSCTSILLAAIQGSGHTLPAFAIEGGAIALYILIVYQITIVHPLPIWRIWLVDYLYFGTIAAGAIVFMWRYDWKSKA
ncbi:MAG: MATE family efflux transporter, partial [Flavobacteriales bacterium]|nr:MATE family efflux transporter [Flavobacteriales bacterium]